MTQTHTEDPTLLHGPPLPPKMAARRLVHEHIRGDFKADALHEYTNALGQPIYWRIRARLPNGEKWIRPMSREGMVYSLCEPSWPSSSRTKPLYRLHKVTQAPRTEHIWIVEGETCAEILERYGAIATTAGGSQSDEKADFEPLRGRPVILWPDNDQAGQDHMQRVANKLRAIGCRVTILDVSVLDLPEKGDAVDFFSDHPETTPEALLAVVQQGASVAKVTHNRDALTLIRGDAVQIRPVFWLWLGWIAQGKLHILAGAPGTGKTTLALDFAATVSKGGIWPDGSRAGLGSILIWSAEDGAEDTLAPRLLAMGADMSRIHFICDVYETSGRRPFDPALDTPALIARAAQIPDLALLILDPIVNLVTGDSHKNTEVRRALAPVVELASALNCAVFGISHFSKGTSGRDPLERVTGSLAFGAMPRIVLAAAKIKAEDDAEKRILARAKSNVGPDGGGFEYELEQRPVPGHSNIFASRLRWGPSFAGSARQLLREPDSTDESASTANDVTAWILELFRENHQIDARTLQRLARDAGYSWRTVQRVQKKLGVRIRRQGFGINTTTIWTLDTAYRPPFAPPAPHD
jgi:hypothetical protein